jgi:hypothetical protein
MVLEVVKYRKEIWIFDGTAYVDARRWQRPVMATLQVSEVTT